MKKLKRAFTLAELLLCIGIIGIVSAMGMVITKHTTEKAYQLYYYTGYINLYNAIADAKANNIESIKDIMQHAENLLKEPEKIANSDFEFNIANNDLPFLSYKAVINNPDIFRSDVDSSLNENNGGTNIQQASPTFNLLDPSDITFKLPGASKKPDESDKPDESKTPDEPKTPELTDPEIERHVFTGANNGIMYAYNVTSATTGGIFIKMAIPVPKTRTNNGYEEETLYFSNDAKGYLIPISPAEGSTAPNLQERKDLLPAYIDDGNVGRNNSINYGSYKDAYCSINPSYTINNWPTEYKITVIIDCTTDTFTDIRPVVSGKQTNGMLKIANPQKVR